jgi:hypothetical protein
MAGRARTGDAGDAGELLRGAAGGPAEARLRAELGGLE